MCLKSLFENSDGALWVVVVGILLIMILTR